MGLTAGVNLGVRFALELAMLAAFCYWGFATGEHVATRILLGVGAPLLAIIVWGSFIAPKARWLLNDPARVGLELGLFGLAAAALAVTDRREWALALVAITIANIGVMFAMDQR